MLLPIVWMKEYVNIDTDIMELINEVTLSGSHVESINDLGEKLNNIVVAKILEIKKHPNADKLSLVKVDYGEKVVEIITGAKNMKEGDLVAFAKLGAILPDGLEIKPIDLKGIESTGMLCSYEELGYIDSVIPKSSANGIIILENGKIGENIIDALQLKDPVVEFEITPNRSDCLSIVGISREVAATFNKKINLPTINIEREEDKIENYFNSIEVLSDNCLRYVGKIVKDVVVKESPQWMQNYLMQAGMRPINNIVDITNYVLLELGQPLHAFDIETLEDKKIIVRQANENEEMTTLDNNSRKLRKTDLVISDGKKPVAIAGVMGGLNSEITNSTKTILVESAVFDADSVRKTSKHLGLRTEASQRFEKGISPEISKYAAERVCELIEETNSGTVVKGSYDIYKKPQEDRIINISVERINKLLGTEISKEEIVNYLENLEFEVEEENDILIVKVPKFRLDISIEEDIIEEVGRLYGFHNIEPKPLGGGLLRGKKSYNRLIEDETKNIMYALGLYEATTYSFISRKAYSKTLTDIDEEELVTLKNPLGEDFSVMRTTLIPNILNVLEKNSKNKIDEFKVYELGNTFHSYDAKKLPVESKKVTLGMYGKYDFYDIKDIVSIYLNQLGLKDLEFTALTDNKTFHPGRAASIAFKGEVLGQIGEISYEVAENYNIGSRVYIAEIDLSIVGKYVNLEKTYKPIIKYPSIERDIAIVVDRNLETAKIENVIEGSGKGLVQKIDLFDIYTGEHVDSNKKSLAYRIVFQSPERTLKEKEVNIIVEDILNELEKGFGAKLRS
ncbi:phenylalanine--tRNA ligase subunit beta [Miniphocaeibacter halophilus]|uniref:Phenylalanine--tRNA ligase subunit beta n=1 Tax=Miniphocaeibacter halophilus TaxID=2931922 RepID=A0AC61MZL0_9FIRM|nr:phenylalanine--tRNA ligase subunit beta [Miniphocaeibacter halophilus]QQK07523.1 phenylalanine--tRNA ligase subunit beta [Miniphocaeibacter halophilus]